jgi:phosphodiesterase/alkaline phosphatase D-like protein
VRTDQPAEVVVRYGTNPTDLQHKSGLFKTSLAHDNTGWIQLKELPSDTKIYYVAETAGGRAGGSGSFRTLPNPEQLRDPQLNPNGLFNFRFEFACGNNQTPGQGAGASVPAFRTMLDHLQDKIHFSIQNGDWLYEDRRDFSLEQWRQQNQVAEAETPEILRLAPTMVGVWENYKVYLSRGENLARYHRHVPTFFTFDDHEILNDVWGAGSPGLRDRRAVFRDIGVQAWYDYLGWSNPVSFQQGIHFGQAALRANSDVLTDERADFTALDRRQAATLHVHWGEPTAGINDNRLDGVGGDPNSGVYEIVEVLDRHRLRIRPAAKANGQASYSIGRRSYYRMRISNCDFFVTDTRTHRELHDTTQPDKPGVSMLGAAQKAWLLDGLRQSDADFVFVVSSVNFMVPHVGGGAIRSQNKDDAWTVFLDEREQLIRAFEESGKPVFVLTGDLHNSFVIRISDRVWEFASGPHNSNNHWYTDEGSRPATGKFQYGPRACDIRWSTYFRNDIPRDQLQHPCYCVVQVNNVFNNPQRLGDTRWVAFERPQVVFQYYDGRTGELRYAESITR